MNKFESFRVFCRTWVLGLVLCLGWTSAFAVDPNVGPGGPILVVTTSSSPFGKYYAEILRTEGFNSFAVADISTVTSTTLASYDTVVLAKMPLTSGQVTTLTNWVTAGGNLIAMAPDAQLASLLGVTATGSTLADRYLLVDTSTSIGSGAVNATMQYHGAASLFTLSGASSIATLYSTASTATSSPAVTLRSVGTSGGQAAMFAYDLATSIVYTRQGNPAWNGQERDGQFPVRSDDFFYGASASDPQPDWVDLNKVAIPQADEQQRLLAKLITAMTLDRKPLPRFWYFPNGYKAVVIMTGDDHGTYFTGQTGGSTSIRFDQYSALSPAGCSVDNWECIRSTSYLFDSSILTNAQAVAYNAAGFEIGVHINTGTSQTQDCNNFTQSSLTTLYDQQFAGWRGRYPTLPAPVSERHHCIVWSDWASAPKVELAHGVRLDTNFYYWPPGWVNNVPGVFTGSAMPMRFADLDGSMIDVFQATTQMTDESGQEYPFTANVLLDRAIGPEEAYGAYTVNAHTDFPTTPASDNVVQAAIARGIPVVAARQMLTWLDGRNASTFSAMTWNGTALNFTVTQATGATGLRGMLPRRSNNGAISTLTRNGGSVAFTIVAVKGVEYAAFAAASGNYVATYAPDSTPPTVTALAPASGTTSVPTMAPVTVSFSESMDVSSINESTIVLLDGSNNSVAATVSYNGTTNVATLLPQNPLAPTTAYTVQVRGGSTGVKDAAGNALASTVTSTFTTWTAPVCNPCSIWSAASVPAIPSSGDGASVELGVKFRVDGDGFITGIRFFKGENNNGPHVGSLWSISGGAPLATVNFTDETDSGWQQANFATPVPVTKDTVYVASYYAPTGNYSDDPSYFATGGADNQMVHALTNAESGGNGVYAYSGTPSTFPDQTWNSTNYWVDVVYSGTAAADNVPPTVTGRTPAPSATGVDTVPAVTATFSEAMIANSITGNSFFLRDPANNVVAANVSYSATTRTATLIPTTALSYSTQYTAVLKGGSTGSRVQDSAGNALASDVTWTFTVIAPPTCNCSLWDATAVPDNIQDTEESALELGVKFRSDVAGTITAIRFYKGPGNVGEHIGTLWSATGTALGSVTFTNETTSGWQQANLATPVAIAANTTYVVSYFAPEGRYASNSAYFGNGYDNGALHALPDSTSSGNGVYLLGHGFPNQSYGASNYWVDIVLKSSAPDTTAPVTTITVPTSVASVNVTTPSIQLGGTATDNLGITQVTWSSDRGGSGTAAGTTNWSVAGLPLQVGANVITVTAKDGAGNASTDTLTVNYSIPDTSPPAVTITSPTSASTYSTTSASLSIGGTASDNIGVTQVTWTNSLGGSGTASGTTTWAASGIALVSGLNTITVAARDAAGNVSTDLLAVTYTPNTAGAPTVVLVSPSSGATGVSTTAPLSVLFSEAMDPSTINTNAIELRKGSTLVPVNVSYNAASFTATIAPSAALTASSAYTLTVKGGTVDPRVKDAGGTAMSSTFTSSFTTGTTSTTCSANPIAAENCLTGNPSTEWDIDDGAGDPTIQGFATSISVNRGSTVQFKIDTDARNYRIDIYRMGYYNGMGARKITSITPSATLPQNQPDCLYQDATGLLDCGNWGVSASWPVPATAVSGIYFAKLTRTDTSGSSHIMFIVRDDASTSKMVFQTSDTTWQAYNNYGGNSLYVGAPATDPARAYKVSYNRPFNTRSVDGGQDWVFNAEYPMVRWLESNGYDLTYISGVDTDRAGSLLLNHAAFLSVGHDEYWSGVQRANVEAARNAGVNLAFFSANEVFWKTRWEASIDGTNTAYRTLVSYKETHANAKIDPTPTWTGSWRDPRFSPPADGGRPENALTGTLFAANDGGTTAIRVPALEGTMRLWRNTTIATLAPNDVAVLTDGTLGYEWDIDSFDASRPQGLIRMSNTTADAPALIDYGSNYEVRSLNHALTMYKHSSGARVFGAGTIQWSWGLDSHHDRGNADADVRMQQATVNLFADMGIQPVTLQAGLVPATASTDTIAPIASILSPGDGTTLQVNSPVTISGSAADTGGGVVASVEVSVDGGTTWRPATGRTTWALQYVPTTVGTLAIKARAVDDSGNIQSPVTTISLTVVPSLPVTCPCSIWSSASTPSVVQDDEGSALQLGLKFKTNTAGQVTAIRFYKGPANNGTHVGSIWSSTGTRLATATFTSESSSGWQQANLGTPLAIAANTTYIVAYAAPNGHYSSDSGYFESNGIDHGPLHALSDTEAGGNGVFAYGDANTYPDQSFGGSNYWVDVVFAPVADTTAPTLAITSPTTGSTYSTTVSTLNLAGTSSDAIGVTQVTWSNSRGGSGTATGTTSWSVSGIALQTGSNVITVTARDAANNPTVRTLTVTYSLPPPDTTNPAITISSPTSSSTYSTSNAALNLSGTASDNVGVTQVTWTNSVGGSGTATGTSSWSVSGITLTAGLNTITLTARDAAGNVGTDILAVTYSDTTAPSVSISGPTSNSTYSTSSNSVNLSGTSSDNVGVTRVTWSSEKGISGTATGTTNWSAAGIRLVNGSQRITVTAVDAAGNTATDVLTVTSSTGRDTTQPTVTITSPTTSTTYPTSSDTITLAGTASDNDVLASVKWSNSTGGSGTATGTTNWSAAGITLKPGANTLTVTATDLAGNTRTDTLTVTFNAPITYGMVAAYSFSEGSGATAGDSSGNNNLGTLTNGTWSTSGKFGKALSFNGSTSRLFVNSSTSLNLTAGMTLMAWVQPTSSSQTNNRTIVRRETNGYWLYAGRTNNTLRPGGGATINGGSRTANSNTALTVNTWTHVAITYDGSNVILYVNGTAVSTTQTSGSITSGSTPLWIGGATNGEYFQGLIDEVRVYNRALSAADINTARNAPIDP